MIIRWIVLAVLVTVVMVLRFLNPDLTETQLFLRYWPQLLGLLLMGILELWFWPGVRSPAHDARHRHQWSRWEIRGEGKIVRRTDRSVVAIKVVQQRSCETCGLSEFKEDDVGLI